MKSARLLAALGALAAVSCASAPPPVASAPVDASPERAAAAARTQATDFFHRGKTHALAGETDCAREAFRDALETFRAAARPGDASDVAFAGELWDSVSVYQPIIDLLSRGPEPERPAARGLRATASWPRRPPQAPRNSRRRGRKSGPHRQGRRSTFRSSSTTPSSRLSPSTSSARRWRSPPPSSGADATSTSCAASSRRRACRRISSTSR